MVLKTFGNFTTDCSKAVMVLVLIMCSIVDLLQGVSYWIRFFLVLIFSVPFSIVITLPGEECAGPYASRAFVCLFWPNFVSFSLRVGIIGWLRRVIVALPELFI